MAKVGILNPYWDTLGGGEKYATSVAKTFLDRHDEVTIYWPDSTLLDALKQRFGINLQGARIDVNGFNILTTKNLMTKRKLESTLDYLFWVSDGSIPFLFAKHNLLHFQVPFHDVSGHSLLNQLKLRRMQAIICNSKFTKKVIDQEYRCRSQVIYPPANQIPAQPKQKVILSVGRFDNLLHVKRQDILIECFKQLNEPEWQLILAGGSSTQNEYLNELKALIGNANIQIICNPSHEELSSLYATASLYWHAAGFGSNLEKSPEKAEHFGISTVEAMSAGVIPLVFAGGGQVEIVTEGENGYLWQQPKELIEKTKSLLNNQETSTKLKHAAQKSALQFSQTEFQHAFNQIIS